MRSHGVHDMIFLRTKVFHVVRAYSSVSAARDRPLHSWQKLCGAVAPAPLTSSPIAGDVCRPASQPGPIPSLPWNTAECAWRRCRPCPSPVDGRFQTSHHLLPSPALPITCGLWLCTSPTESTTDRSTRSNRRKDMKTTSRTRGA
jgi:hypothetical protein